MNFGELIDEVISRLPKKDVVSRAQIERIVKTTFQVITEKVAGGDRVAVPKFGAFASAFRNERVAHSPQDGSEVHIPAHWVPSFKASTAFKDACAKR